MKTSTIIAYTLKGLATVKPLYYSLNVLITNSLNYRNQNWKNRIIQRCNWIDYYENGI